MRVYIKAFLLIFLLPSHPVLADTCPFGENAFVWNNYSHLRTGTSIGDYIHPSVDIYIDQNQPIIALEDGIVWGFDRNDPNTQNPNFGANDCELWIGNWDYAHLDYNKLRGKFKELFDGISDGGFIEVTAGETLGYVTTPQSGAASNWLPHLDLTYVGIDKPGAYSLNNSIAMRNPYPALDELLSDIDICDCVKESIDSTSAEIHFTGQGEMGSGIIGNPPVLYGDIDVQAEFDIRVNVDSQTRGTSPYQMKWGIDGNELGFATVDGELPRLPSHQKEKIENLFSYKDWIISNLAGSYEATDRDLDDVQDFDNYWNTLQRLDDPNWQNTAYPCSLDTRKFPDGPHKVWVWARTYCGTVVAETVDVIIDNNPPQTEVEKVDPNKGRDYFTGITYIGFRHVQVYRYDFTCGSDLTVIDTLGMMYNVRQRDAIYRFENGMDIGQVGAFIGMHATLYSTDENPVITPVGSGRAKKYTGFTGGDAIELLKEDGNRYYSGGCGSDAPQGMYYIDDDCFLIADIPGVRAAIMNFGVDYGSLHDIAIALGMPASIIIGEEGSTRPNIPGNETEPQKKPDLPTEYSLGPPRPNPFNTTVCFDIELPRASLVDLRIYDILGRLVDTPINHTEIPAGKFTKNWACPNCPSGTYYIVFQTKDFHQSRKMTMVK